MDNLMSVDFFKAGIVSFLIGISSYVVLWIIYKKNENCGGLKYKVLGETISGFFIVVFVLLFLIGLLYLGTEAYEKDMKKLNDIKQKQNEMQKSKNKYDELMQATATAKALMPPKVQTITKIYSLNLEKNVSYSSNVNGNMNGGFLLGIGLMGGSVSGQGNTTIEFRYYFYKQIEDGYLLDSASSINTLLVESDKEQPCLKIFDKGYNKLIIPKNTIKKEFNVNFK
jgi:hypothetical protein